MNSSSYSMTPDNVPILYFDELTPQARSCIMLIHMLKIPVEMRYIDLFNGAHLKEEYAAINPLRTVPTLVHGNLTLFDGHTILMYLCENFGGVKCKHLFPENVALRYDIVSKLFFESNILYRRHSEFLTELLRKTATYADIEFYEKKILGSYDILENLLKNSNYLCCDWLTLADISCVTTVSALHLMFPIEESRWPRVHNWFRNIRLRPEYKYNLSGIEKQRELMKTVGHFDIRDKIIDIPNIQTLQNQYIYSDYDLAAPIVMAAIEHQLPPLPIDAFVVSEKPKDVEKPTSTSINQIIKEESVEKLKKVNNKKTSSKASLKSIKKPQAKSKEKLKTVFEIEKEMFKELEDNLKQRTEQLQEVQSTMKNVHEIKLSINKQKPEEKIEPQNSIAKIKELPEKSIEKEDKKVAEKEDKKVAEKEDKKVATKEDEKLAEKEHEKVAEKEHKKEFDKELEQQSDKESEQTLTSSQQFQRKFGHNVIKKSAREYFTKRERHSEEDSKYTLTDKIVENKVKLKNLKKNNTSTQSNIWSNKVKPLYTSTSKDNFNLPKNLSNLTKDKTNLTKDKTNLTKVKSNLTKVKSNLSKDKTNLTKDKTNLTKDKTNLIKVKSNLTKVKSNLSKVKSNLSKNKSNLSKETSNFSKESSNFSKETSNLSKDTSNFSKDTSNLSKDTSNFSKDTSNFSKATSLVSGKSTSFGESSSFSEKTSNATTASNKEKVVKTVSLKEEILNSIKSFEEKTKPLTSIFEVSTSTVPLSKVISDAALNKIKSTFQVKEFKSKESDKTPVSVRKATDATAMKTPNIETSKMESSFVNKRYIKPIKADDAEPMKARILLNTVNSDVSERFLKSMLYANNLQRDNSLQKIEREVLARPEVINEIIENVDKKKVIPTTTSKMISSKTISPKIQNTSTQNIKSSIIHFETKSINPILEIRKEEEQLEKLINEKAIIKMKNKWLSQTINKSKVSLVDKLSTVDMIHFSKPNENELNASNQLHEVDRNSIDDIFRVTPNESSTSSEKFIKNYDTQLNKIEKLDGKQEADKDKDKDKDLPSTSKKYIDKLERDVEQKIFSTYCLPGISQNLMENYPMKCGLKNIGLLGKNINRESKDTENNYGIFIVDENSDIELQANGNVYSLKLSGAKVKNAPKSLQSILSRPRPIKRSSVIKPKTNKHSKKSTEDDNEAHGSTSKKSLLSSLSRKNRATYKKVSFQTKKPKTKLKSKKTTESSKRDSDA